MWRFSLYYVAVFGAYVALASVLPAYYVANYGVSLATAGLLTAAQAALLRRAPAAAAPGDAAAAAGAAHNGLMRLEALRIWRVAAAYGIPFMHMDTAFESVCALLEPPPADSHNGDESVPALQWLLRAEALQLFEALVAHAMRAASGAAPELGAEMVGPECVAAVAGAAARAWTAPAAVEAVARALVARADATAPPLAGTDAGSGALPLHPAQLVPPAHAALAALAAAWHLIASATAGPGPGQRKAAAEAWQHLQAAGLSRAPAGAAAAAGTGDALALALLRLQSASEGGGGGGAGNSAALGEALLRHLAHLACPATAAAAAKGDSAASPCASFAAASALAALCRLEAGARDAAVPALAAEAGSGLAHFCAGAAAEEVAARAAAAGPAPTALEPWDIAGLHAAQAPARLLLQATALLPPQPAPAAVVSLDSSNTAAAAAAEGEERLRILDGLLCSLTLAPPGAEAQALAALEAAFGDRCGAALARVARAALEDARALRDGGDGDGGSRELANAAAGLRAGAAAGARPPYPAPGAVDVEAARALLREGYAAGWLSVVPRDRVAGGRAAAATAQQQQQQPALPPLRRPCADEPHGSRLPLPPGWIASEALAVPGGPADPSAARAGAEPPHPAGAALTLAAGCRALGLACASAPSAPALLRAAVCEAYLGNAWELLPRPPPSHGAGGGSIADADEVAPAWRDPAARWALAALTRRLAGSLLGEAQSSGSSGSGGSGWAHWLGEPAAERLAQLLAESSMGDPLLGAHAALLLLPAGGAPLQCAAWAAHAARSALHLLPPPGGCLGGGAPYARGPFAFELVAAAAKSLAGGELDKALQLDSIAASVALHAIAAAALDPRQWAAQQAAEDAAVVAAAAVAGGGSRSGSGSGSNDGSGVPPRPPPSSVDVAGRATNVLRGVVRGAAPEVLPRLLAAARERGVPDGEARRALALCTHGDAELMERVARALAAASG